MINHTISLILIFSFCILANADVPPKPLIIVALGDSITEGYGLTKEESYPSQLQKKLQLTYPQIKIINAGISGSTTASAESRLKWQLKNKPNILLLALGANDGLRGINTDSLKSNLEKTILLAKANNIYIVLAGMKMPMNYGNDYRKKYEAVFFDLAKKYKIDFIPFLLEGVATVKTLNIEDGIHPNAEGYKKVAEHILPTLQKAIPRVLSEQGSTP